MNMADDGFTLVADAAHIRIDGDLVYLRIRGVMTLRDLNAMIEIYQGLYAQHDRLFAVYDVTQSEGIDRAGRKALSASRAMSLRPTATAIFGASFAMRTMASMIERALVGLGRPPTGMKFFETEALALAYIDEQRRRLLNPGGG